MNNFDQNYVLISNEITVQLRKTNGRDIVLLAQQTGIMIWKIIIFKLMLINKAKIKTHDSIESPVGNVLT